MAGGAEVPAFAKEGHEVFTCILRGMAAVFALHTVKIVVQIAAIEIAIAAWCEGDEKPCFIKEVM